MKVIDVNEASTFKWKSCYSLALSLLFFLVVALMNFLYVEERLLHEGGKELVGVINNKSFFFLHPERLLMIISQIFPLIGVKLGCSLNTLTYLYSFNLLLTTFVIFQFCLYAKDYAAGIYLCTFHIVGMGFNFFLYPFLEHLYALTFCYLLFLLLNDEKRGKYTSVVIVLLTVLICTAHPTCMVFVLLLIFRTGLSKNERIFYSLLCISTLLATLLYTEISIQNRIGSLDIRLIPLRLFYFVLNFPDLLLLSFVTLCLILKSQNRILLLSLFALSISPYFFYFQLPTYYFALPCGFSILFLLTEKKLKKSKVMYGLLVVLFAWNTYRIVELGRSYKSVSSKIKELIAIADKVGGSKFIIVKDESNKRYFENNLDFRFAESIKHVSLLFSSIKENSNSVIIESYDFNYESFDGAGYFQSKEQNESEIISFIQSLYEDATYNNLYEKHQYNYEYTKYFDTNHHLNQKYFTIKKAEGYKILK